MSSELRNFSGFGLFILFYKEKTIVEIHKIAYTIYNIFFLKNERECSILIYVNVMMGNCLPIYKIIKILTIFLPK